MGEEETEEAPSPPPPLATLCSGGILSEPDLDSIPKIAHGRERERRGNWKFKGGNAQRKPLFSSLGWSHSEVLCETVK